MRDFRRSIQRQFHGRDPSAGDHLGHDGESFLGRFIDVPRSIGVPVGFAVRGTICKVLGFARDLTRGSRLVC